MSVHEVRPLVLDCGCEAPWCAAQCKCCGSNHRFGVKAGGFAVTVPVLDAFKGLRVWRLTAAGGIR